VYFNKLGCLIAMLADAEFF